MARIQISNDPSGRITVSFPYDPFLVEKAKTIPGRRWHPVERYRSFTSTDGTPSPPPPESITGGGEMARGEKRK